MMCGRHSGRHGGKFSVLAGSGGRIGGKRRDVKATGRFRPVVPGRAEPEPGISGGILGVIARPSAQVRTRRGMTVEWAGRLCAPDAPPITKTAVFKVPYHHIKGVFTPENSGEFRQLSAPRTLFAARFGLTNKA